MAGRASLDLWSYDVRLARGVSEPLDEARLDFHRWLSRFIEPDRPRRSHQKKGTTNLDIDQIRLEPQKIASLLDTPSTDTKAGHIIVDLSANAYRLLRDPFLGHLADVMAGWIEERDHVVFALLVARPSRSSLFWQSLNGVATSAKGRLFVIDSRGEVTPLGAEIAGLPELLPEYADRLGELKDGRGALEPHVLRRVGHFNSLIDAKRDQATGQYLECGHFAWDASAAVNETADELVSKIRSGGGCQEHGLILAPTRTTWMKEVALSASQVLGKELVTLGGESGSKAPPALSTAGNFVLCDTVASGATIRKVVQQLNAWDRPALAPVLSVFGATRGVRLSDTEYLEVESLRAVELPTVQAPCPQCLAGVEFSPPDLTDEPLRGLSAFDFWEMVLSFDWGREPYGAPQATRFDRIPDFRRVFQEYGDWIAFKYDALLQYLQFGREVVIVCPDEEAVQALVDHLRGRFEERLVAVAIPRRVITHVKRLRSRSALGRWEAQTPEPDWSRQLRHLRATREASVVVIDEFNASGSTVKAICRLLDHYDVAPSAYLPFWDRAPRTQLPGLRAYAMYTIDSPRPL